MRNSPEFEALLKTRSYAVFAAFIRRGPVRKFLMEDLGLSGEDYAKALVDLDNRQAELYPETIDDIAPKTRGKLRAIFERVNVLLRKRGSAR